MGMFEGKSNAFSICHSQVGPKKSRKWERCVREVKKQLGEGKNPNPGEKESPKAKKVSPEQAKDEVLDLIINLLQK